MLPATRANANTISIAVNEPIKADKGSASRPKNPKAPNTITNVAVTEAPDETPKI
ncbi:hypothetical protein D3C76_1835770 [compost metagenome]